MCAVLCVAPVPGGKRKENKPTAAAQRSKQAMREGQGGGPFEWLNGGGEGNGLQRSQSMGSQGSASSASVKSGSKKRAGSGGEEGGSKRSKQQQGGGVIPGTSRGEGCSRGVG